MNFNNNRQCWIHDKTLNEIRVVIGLLIYGGVFEPLHEYLESLYKMNATGRLIFLAVMGKNCFRFLLLTMRFGDKVTRAKQRLIDKLAAFRKIWNMFVEICNSMYLVTGSVCIDEQLLPFQRRCAFLQYMPKKQSKFGIKMWMMCDCATNYMINAKVYLGKENNEVAR